MGIGSTVAESSPGERGVALKEKAEENFETLDLNIQQVAIDGDGVPGLIPAMRQHEFQIQSRSEAAPTPSSIEHQFIPSITDTSPLQGESVELKNVSAMRNGSGDYEFSVSLQLGEPELKRRKRSESQLAS